MPPEPAEVLLGLPLPMINSAETGTAEAVNTENNATQKKAFNFTGIPLFTR
jgi:hypothetical protein